MLPMPELQHQEIPNQFAVIFRVHLAVLPHDLIDEYRLAIYPVLLGGGVRLFPDDGALHRLKLVDSKPTTTGVILATYRSAV